MGVYKSEKSSLTKEYFLNKALLVPVSLHSPHNHLSLFLSCHSSEGE
jgi:hypothetical protein